MATSGIYGIRKGGIDKLQYVGYDAYPSDLGETVVRFIEMSDGIPELSMLFDKWECVKADDMVRDLTLAQFGKNKTRPMTIEEYQGDMDMAELIGNLQGKPHEYLDNENLTLFICENKFIKSPSCEWGYIINLDTEMLEIWQGGQRTPQKGNRYGEEAVFSVCTTEFYPCALVKQVPISTIMDFKYRIEDDEELEDDFYVSKNSSRS